MSRVVCFSHREDVDGLSSAALIKAAFNAKSVILVDYSNMIYNLQKLIESLSLPSSPDLATCDKVFICDLGLNKKNEKIFIDLLGKLIAKGCKVTYIDHHDLNKEVAVALKRLGVVLVHSLEECTSILVYKKYKRKFKAQAAFFAAAGALTDYMENRPVASAIISRFDRQFLMLQSTALSYMISANQNNYAFLIQIVDTLSQMKYPHEIEGGFSIAEKYAKKVSEAVKSIEQSIVRLENLAHANSTGELSASVIVNFVLGASEKPVAMVYKLKEDINSFVVSIRASKDCKVHLGKLVNHIATEMGGSGGGHAKASGAVVPKDRLDEFIQVLDARISNLEEAI
jgi:single-stranded-DNA-specific exonuclease